MHTKKYSQIFDGLFLRYHDVILFTDGENLYVGVGDNTILDCDEAKHQPGITSVEWFCRLEIITTYHVYDTL